MSERVRTQTATHFLGEDGIVRTILNCTLPIGDLRMLKSSRI